MTRPILPEVALVLLVTAPRAGPSDRPEELSPKWRFRRRSVDQLTLALMPIGAISLYPASCRSSSLSPPHKPYS